MDAIAPSSFLILIEGGESKRAQTLILKNVEITHFQDSRIRGSHLGLPSFLVEISSPVFARPGATPSNSLPIEVTREEHVSIWLWLSSAKLRNFSVSSSDGYSSHDSSFPHDTI
jgi:hypothetical protein